jgi:TolA-binding protein
METNETTRPNVGRMEAQLKALGAKLDKLVAHLEGVETQVKDDSRKRIDDLKAKRAVVRARLDELKAAESKKWEILKAGFYHAWNDLEAAFKALKHTAEEKKPGPGSVERTEQPPTPPAGGGPT